MFAYNFQICFWLIENNYRVLIAACDTFRAGAVEQLRTHMQHLNALHPPEKHNFKTMAELFEQVIFFIVLAVLVFIIRRNVKMGILSLFSIVNP